MRLRVCLTAARFSVLALLSILPASTSALQFQAFNDSSCQLPLTDYSLYNSDVAGSTNFSYTCQPSTSSSGVVSSVNMYCVPDATDNTAYFAGTVWTGSNCSGSVQDVWDITVNGKQQGSCVPAVLLRQGAEEQDNVYGILYCGTSQRNGAIAFPDHGMLLIVTVLFGLTALIGAGCM